MNIYDCFMYFDEDLLLDLRLNSLNKYIKKFVITEATYTHNGNKKKLNFDINNFKKFKDKIEYIVVDTHPQNILKLVEGEPKNKRGEKLILNGMARDYFQRENLTKGLREATDEDLIFREETVEGTLCRITEVAVELHAAGWAVADLLKDLFQPITGGLGVKANHADRRLVIEDGCHDGAIADHRQLDAVLASLMEEHGKLIFSEELGHLTRGGVGAGDKGGDGLLIDGAGISAVGHHVTFLVDEQVAFAAGKVEEVAEDLIDARDVLLVEDEALVSQMVAVTDHFWEPSRFRRKSH